MNPPPAERNFWQQQLPHETSHRETVQPTHGLRWQFYHMANRYSTSRRTFKWTTKLFFHFPDLTVLNSWILLSSCGAKYTHQDFRFLLVRNLIEEAGKSQDRPNPRLIGRLSAAATNVLWLESRHNKHWKVKSSTHLRCRLCSSRGQRKRSL